MEKIPLNPSRDLQDLKLQIDGFSDPFERGFILEIQFHQKTRFPDILIALELAS
ncbi:hypothetical protein [Leptospira mayottensis]|uniref:Uncharacterized protein n=2 Tax=Leptospira mayottensis TaxID=1137606 RepID=A0AA87MQC6_9LEPT|nr:hypothetical protein [Leptospira mayottensis]EKS00401.1 hypothetical protein LEP1GSC125_2300 [Leptospira mayottensis 200901122]